MSRLKVVYTFCKTHQAWMFEFYRPDHGCQFPYGARATFGRPKFNERNKVTTCLFPVDQDVAGLKLPAT